MDDYPTGSNNNFYTKGIEMTLSILHILGFLVATAVFLLFLAGCLWLFGYAVGRGVAIGFNHENEEEQTKNN